MPMLKYPITTFAPLIINEELFNGLSKNQQTILKEVGSEYFGEVWQKSWENDYTSAMKIFEDAECQVYYPTDEEALLWQEANKRAVPIAIERAGDSGLSKEESLAFIDRVYDVLEANGLEVNRYTED